MSRLQKYSVCIFYLENAVLSYANKIHVAFVTTEAIFPQHFIVFLLSNISILLLLQCEFKSPQLSPDPYLLRPDLRR